MEQKIKYQGFQKINRLYGEDGYETAERIVEHMNVSTGTPIVIVSGENYPDALSISSMAAYNQYPIFLAKKDELMDSVRKEISAIKPSKVYIIGLQRSISTAVEEMVSQMIPIEKANIIRIGGLDRYETSLEIAKQFNSSGKLACVATGNNFPDALVGSVFAARSKAPLILVDETLSETVVTYLRNNGIIGVTIFGGEAVISNGIQQELSQLVGK
jgi:putative cell wall-binding protein